MSTGTPDERAWGRGGGSSGGRPGKRSEERGIRVSMDCIRVSQNIYDYLDGEIGRWRERAVARHLHHCAFCSSGFEFEARLRQTLGAKCRDEPPPELRNRILTALEQAALRTPDEASGPDLPGPLGLGS